VQGDSMTKSEMEQFRTHISRELKIGATGSPVYHFSAELLKEAGAAPCGIRQTRCSQPPL
jgi:hypothetical protein